MTRPRAVVVVAYGAPDYLPDALEPLVGEYVVVVDNSAAPSTRALAERLGFVYIDAGSNLGFAGGVNVGLRHVAARGEPGDVLLLNPDAQVQPEVIDELQAALDADPTLAAVSPSLVGADGSPQLATYPLPSPAQMWRFAVGLGGRWDRSHVIGAVLLLRAEAITDIGEFDERFFLYGEEVDWQRRALDRGWRVAEVASVRALHHGGMSSDDDAVRITRVVAGQEGYVHRWYGGAGSASFRAAGWLATTLRTRSGSWSAARLQARCFRLGPRRVAPLPPAPRRLSILHLTDRASISVVTRIVAAQSRAGHEVAWREVSSPAAALRVLGGRETYDVVHAHGAAAAVVACATGALHGTRVAVSDDTGATEGSPSPVVRMAASAMRRRVDLVVPALGAEGEAPYREPGSSGARKRNIA